MASSSLGAAAPDLGRAPCPQEAAARGVPRPGHGSQRLLPRHSPPIFVRSEAPSDAGRGTATMTFRSIYRHGFARVAACTVRCALADPMRNAEAVLRVAGEASDRGAA